MEPTVGCAIAIDMLAKYHGITIAQAESRMMKTFVIIPPKDKRLLMHAADYWDICRSDFLEYVRQQQNGYPMVDYEIETPSEHDQKWDNLSKAEQEKYATLMSGIFNRFMTELLKKPVDAPVSCEPDKIMRMSSIFETLKNPQEKPCVFHVSDSGKVIAVFMNYPDAYMFCATKLGKKKNTPDYAADPKPGDVNYEFIKAIVDYERNHGPGWDRVQSDDKKRELTISKVEIKQ